jgi:peroxiredoxin
VYVQKWLPGKGWKVPAIISAATCVSSVPIAFYVPGLEISCKATKSRVLFFAQITFTTRSIMKRAFRVAQLMGNVGIVVISLLLSLIVLDRYLGLSTRDQAEFAQMNKGRPPSSARPPAEDLIGKQVPVSSINWTDSSKTLVLVLSTTCRFCTESAPFYSRLAEERSRSGFKMVAILPQEAQEANRYLETHNIKVDHVVTGSPSSVGVSATPTLLLVDQAGTILDHWRGKLPSDKEESVIARLQKAS